jgi:GT2 family glycosyltransferase
MKNICLASSLYSREVYNACGGYDERFKHGLEDYALYLKASQQGFNFAKCETTGLYYRRHAESMSGNKVFEKYREENYKLLKSTFGEYYLGRG